VPPNHLYLHVPFCARRCSYCDFSIAVRRVVPVSDFIEGVRRELEIRYPTADQNQPWTLNTLYLGGGTPSHLGPSGITTLLATIREFAQPTAVAEVTIEANPEDVTPAAAATWIEAGVNRVSLGAQSFDDAVLAWMHRVHDSTAISRAVNDLRSAGFSEISLDLIFAVPAELNRDWQRDVELAIAQKPEHISLYGLTVEPATPLGRWHSRGQVEEAPEETYEADFLLADRLLAAAGYEHYEVSNYALSGFRARHNSTYWSGVSYAGIGPAAHEYDGTNRRWNVPPYAEWLRLLREGKDPIAGKEELTAANRIAEDVYLGLRTTDGLDLRGSEPDAVAPWIAAGWATLRNGRLVLSPAGWLRLDSLAGALIATREPTFDVQPRR
jgi:oxygen-independent coproporphyrinogen III oxidase